VSNLQALEQAVLGSTQAFEQLVKPYHRRLHLHCYRMLGSPFDADDALQETLLAAWRGMNTFESRSTLLTWLTTIATRVCLRMVSQRQRRKISSDYSPPLSSTSNLGDMVTGPVWVEPIPDGELQGEATDADDPASLLFRRENVSLAFVALLQHLPGTQRAALLMQDVLGYSAAETAHMLETSVASVTSALQRARATLAGRAAASPEAARPTESPALNTVLDSFVSAWERRDIEAIIQLLTKDARFTMPPLPAWFDGRDAVVLFFQERIFATAWRLAPLSGNGQSGFACYQQQDDGRFRPGGVVLLTISDGRIAAIDSFLDPKVCQRFGMLEEFA
jgi:RNA polymerase sigma-70 factor (TIGR02960 family)